MVNGVNNFDINIILLYAVIVFKDSINSPEGGVLIQMVQSQALACRCGCKFIIDYLNLLIKK
jgi:hypothetical protein